MASGKNNTTKWIPPLPHGWEARYDTENKAYFFIDHVHKKTQWDDPRFNSAQQTQPQTQATSTAAASSLGLGRGPVPSHDSIALQDMTHLHTKNQSQKSRSIFHEASLTNEVDAALVNKLKAEFPKATKELISDMLALCHNSERETREQLNDLGFLANNSKGKNSNPTSPQKNTNAGMSTTKKSVDTHPLSPVESATPASNKEIPDADMKRISVVIQAKDLFPKLDPEVVRLAAKKCHYNLEELKVLLTAWEKRYDNNEQSWKTGVKNGSSSANSSLSSVRSFSPVAGSLEPVGLDDTTAHKLNSSAHPSGNVVSPKRSTGVSNVTQSLVQGAKGDAVPPAKTSCSQHARAKQVTKPKQPAKASQPAVVTSQPVVEHKSNASQYRTTPKGPDANLRKGPDSTLLTTDYTQANGPDKSIRAGPDRSNIIGSQGAVGPDLSLRCGSQSLLLQENRNNNTPTSSNMLSSHL